MNSNFRRVVVGLSLLVGVAVNGTATARAPIINVGSGSNSDRLSQIETAVNSQGQLLYQIQQQLSDSQRDIDMLRGQIQENQYKLNQLVENQKDLYMKLDQVSGSDTPAASADNSSSTTPAPAISSQSGNEKDDYNQAVQLAMNSKSKAQIDEAINALQGFIKSYPKSSYQSNANYWLGSLITIKVAKMMPHSTLRPWLSSIQNHKKAANHCIKSV